MRSLNLSRARAIPARPVESFTEDDKLEALEVVLEEKESDDETGGVPGS